jgi:predicted PurR-regulated permease PerM
MKEASAGLLVFLSSLWSGGRALVSLLSLLVVTPVVALYLLVDWDRIVAAIDRWLPRDHVEVIRMLAREMDAAISGFVRGQIGICLILAAIYVLGFAIVGLKFGFLIGVIGGMASFVPYVGSFGTFLVACAVGVAQFWPEWTPIIGVVAVCVVAQFLEGYVLSPYLVGAKVGLHPVWLMFALFAFSYLFGFLGLLVAIPLSAAVGVLIRYALRRYLASPFYTGHGA